MIIEDKLSVIVPIIFILIIIILLYIQRLYLDKTEKFYFNENAKLKEANNKVPSPSETEDIFDFFEPVSPFITRKNQCFSRMG